jgi:putative tricarboxylic transport membrane protein
MKAQITKVATLIVLAAVIPLFSATVYAAWQPLKPVEFVVPWPAGGGTDVFARTVAAIVETEKLAAVPLVVVNKVGGNAMVAQSYVLGKKGDPHILEANAWTLTMVPVMENLPLSVTLLTPIARMFLDEQLYWVKWDSPFKSIKDLVNAAKKAPGTVKVAGVVIGSEDHVTNIIFETAAGIKTNYIAFRGGGDIMRELLGGHVDAAILNPSEAVSQQEAKLVRPLAVASTKRLPGMPDVPTFREEGYDVVFEEFQRGVTAPPGIPPEVANYYVDLMRRVTETPKWKTFLKENMVTPAFLGGKEYGDYIKRQEDMVRKVLTPLGLVKQ